jgi:aryl-alcohol dehydrogenase-like predicted oxidoreductase
MRYEIFGQKTGLRVSTLVLGGGMFGTANGYGASSDDVQAILRNYVDAGGNFIDTSDAYQQGQSEAAIGEFITGNRENYVVASKYSRTAARTPAIAAAGAHRKAMVQSVEASLKRLKTDHIDLYFVHIDDGLTPMEEVARGFDDLARAGKIIYAGFSNTPAWRVTQAAVSADLRGWVPTAALQIEYSLLQRSPERDLLPMARELGLGVMGYSPLAGGLLTGKYRAGEEGRATALKGAVAHKDDGHGATVIDAVIAISQELDVTPGQVAIAWAMSKGIFTIIGPRTPSQLQDNLGAMAVNFSTEAMERLTNASKSGPGSNP